jgi:hypothetical protein
MKSWKTRLLMVLAALAMVLAVSIPAIADDVDVSCDVDDGGVCRTNVTVDSYQPEEDDPGLEGVDVEAPVVEGVDDACFPFCDVYWPW